MIDETVWTVFFIGLIGVSSVVIALSLRQVFVARQDYMIRSRVRSLRTADQLPVTVLLYVAERTDDVAESLRMIMKSRYAAYDVVVVDDTLSRETARVIRAAAAYPGHVRTLTRRRPTAIHQTLHAGYRKSQRGRLVMVIEPGAQLEPSSIKRAVVRYQRSGKSCTVPSEMSTEPKISTTLQLLQRTLWRQTPRVYMCTTAQLKKSDRRDVWRRVLPPLTHTINVMLFAGCIALGLVGHNFLWVVCGWVLVTTYLLASSLLSRQPIATKLMLMTAAPSAFFTLPAASLVWMILRK